ncbi:MAG TPA: ribose-5-phosphate isomerase RpiA [Blastocatellia bacterium]|nr:ribose-5-phosphate isomerase RpiA [Blastocatellia bacterium]
MQDESKKRAAEHAIDMVRDGNIVGLGTGSTAKFAIEGLGRLVRGGLSIKGVPTSIATQKLAQEQAIPLIELNDVDRIDITIDGADEIDSAFDMIKGGGGALTREKLVALSSKKRVILVDESKLVSKLGQSHLLPVEVLPFAWKMAQHALEKLGGTATLRMRNDQPLITDNGNYILDCGFGAIENARHMESEIKLLPAVIECGLFIGIADTLVIGFEDRVEVRKRH